MVEPERGQRYRLRPKPIAGSLPKQVRKEIAAFARWLKREYRALFGSDPLYRKRAGQFLTALLLPKPRRRGRPVRADITKAIRLLSLFSDLSEEIVGGFGLGQPAK